MSQGGNDDKQAPKIPAMTIGEKLNKGTENIKSLSSFACIYKVPEDLRKVKECAYIPRLIAIGPLHRRYEHLQKPMQDVKMDYANRLFRRLTEGIADSKIRDKIKDKLIQGCEEKMKKCTVKAKKYYAEELDLSDYEMMEMMLVDGCFILELLYVYYHNIYCQMAFPQPVTGGEDGSSGSGGEKQYVDPILYNISSANIIKQDLILLENQIPYFVLEQLFELTVDKIPDVNKLSLEEYVLFFFSEYFSEVENCGSKTKTCSCFPKDCVLWVSDQSKENERETKRLEDDKRKDYFHILHLLQDRLEDCYFPGFKRINSTKFSEFKVSAADLHNAGVEFLSHPSDVYVTEGISWRFNGIRFYILGLVIHERTEVFLRNLIALEQCNDPNNIQRKFTSYVKVMSMLINSEKDVQVLKDAGIIHNYLGTDKDVPKIFDKLCEGVTVPGDLYLDAWQEAIKYYNGRNCLPMTMRYWRRLIFTSTWGVLAFALGIITSFITVAQFVRDFRK